MGEVLSDAVLPLIRTRTDLHRWSAANAHGRQMHEAVDLLEGALEITEPGEAYAVAQKALASASAVIARADDSSGIIGDACRRLLALHPRLAAAASVPPSRLVDWMMKFQFHGDVDYFEIDPVAYAPALGERGLATYRARLREVEDELGPRPDERWRSPRSHEWFVLDWNAQRLAVLDRDVDAIVATHARDGKVAAWFEDTARAFEEIGETELAIAWARRAADFDRGHQSLKAADYWCRLLAAHQSDQVLEARLVVFRRWPSSTTAARLHETTGAAWPEHREEVLGTLSRSPRDAVLFALLTLDDVGLAWHLAHSLDLDAGYVWSDLLQVYEKVDPIAVLPVHRRLVEGELVETGAQHYRIAARRLVTMRRLAAGTDHATEIDAFVAELRHQHRRRPRLGQEFDRAGLP